jgi:hypothetical protein
MSIFKVKSSVDMMNDLIDVCCCDGEDIIVEKMVEE